MAADRTSVTTSPCIVKSPEDKRLYRGLNLSNDLKVLLVSDPSTDKSAAALDVHVGSMSDPKSIPGLAHFCEHMLFMGTQKYPEENDYGKYISQHSGFTNAFTSSDHTNYHFDVSSDKLEPALDRFSRFFIEPLFSSSSVDREVKAVNSEYEKNLASDFCRSLQLEKHLSDPSHDYSKFGTGNIKTLGEDPKARGESIREALLSFHDKYYSANIMTLCLLGKESLDELQDLVIQKFSPIINKSLSVPEWKNHPCINKGVITYVEPVMDLRDLCVSFPIPDLQKEYTTAPARYIAHLAGHEGPGSLLSELKSRGWVSKLGVGEKPGAKGFQFFVFVADLTEEGLEKIDDIVGLIFGYLNLLRSVGPLKWIFDEYRNINDMSFRFKGEEKPMGLVSSLAYSMHEYPIEHVLYGPYIVRDWKPELITSFLEKLKPENAVLFVVSKKFSEIADETEPWYGTKYNHRSINPEKLQKWADESEIHSNFKIPEPNEFIPSNFSLRPRDFISGEYPKILADTERLRIWFKQDDEFHLPKSHMVFLFKAFEVNSSPDSYNLAVLFSMALKDSLNEYVYSAEIAGLDYNVHVNMSGFSLHISGYNEKQSVLLSKVLNRIQGFVPDPKRFKILKEEYVRSLQNSKMDQPHKQSVYNNNYILSEKQWHKNERLDSLFNLEVNELTTFIVKMLSRTYVEGIIHGNVSADDAEEVVLQIETFLKTVSKPLSISRCRKLKDREIALSSESAYVFKTENEYHKSSSIETYFQVGPIDMKSRVLIEFVSQLLNEPCFNVLRTQEQLGYLVFSGIRRSNGVQGLRIIIQSDRHPEYLESRIEAFLLSMYSHIRDMSSEEFEKNRKALKDFKLEKPKKMSERFSKFLMEIESNNYDFDRLRFEVEELEKLSQEELLEFYYYNFHPESKNRKKISNHVLSKATDGAGTKDKIDMVCDISDATEAPKLVVETREILDESLFKISRPLYPRKCSEKDIAAFKR